jgi:hypothetical protein
MGPLIEDHCGIIEEIFEAIAGNDWLPTVSFQGRGDISTATGTESSGPGQ